MRSIIVVTIVLHCCALLHAFPLGQIIKYRVSSKYFNRNNDTTTSDEHSRESLYNLLTQIHYGDAASQPTATIAQEDVNEIATEANTATTNESPEEPTTESYVTEDSTSIDFAGGSESEEVVSTPAATEITENSQDIGEDHDGDSETEGSSTIVPTEAQATDVTVTTEAQESDVEDEAESEIPDSLLSAVGDLLSSVLGISIDDTEDDEKEAAPAPVTTETDSSTSTETEQSNETVPTADDSKMTEIDEMIENLNVQNTFMTEENAPELFTEAVKDGNDEVEVLEVLAPVTDQPVSIEASVNHVMNLVKGAAESADKQVKNVYSTLKEISTSLGLTDTVPNEEEEEVDALKSLPIDSFDHETIKNFETDINEIVSASANPEDPENFLPNVAKAAMYYKYQYDEDF